MLCGRFQGIQYSTILHTNSLVAHRHVQAVSLQQHQPPPTGYYPSILPICTSSGAQKLQPSTLLPEVQEHPLFNPQVPAWYLKPLQWPPHNVRIGSVPTTAKRILLLYCIASPTKNNDSHSQPHCISKAQIPHHSRNGYIVAKKEEEEKPPSRRKKKLMNKIKNKLLPLGHTTT
ncbi:hypothetical protein M441DRAFT_424288 [Trichoderma asperellum CBS 433.97]|uniref:Uncharacterized protein n=1 Tax=Trichoderma asperellum (strain ATCC 204424 / CBS 433.97 / NBRC 101777) TaxID=1042311 RepID=A0A2T3Z591_TRIA4|nr:hypothetical protein M441DRAFT_424288 [Trichoderma asperellum CBS 433.97]PTB39979.1 hypothetical protein M441DRAFT_424288 [Trichoderma asperellum CBS 433.97]